ncbi:hypothetical protein [Candidatus Venteria ishoeyi]|uniref:Uncharacterized protein n=1 Tax=Candidatus Venteria ishoeyi TaxID=1899563 RepID=A0A1H6FC08_9GAMM|nr:hypothetical protein [Candidatus Venteria ishoeyi]MDM8546270.1 hypothetical protein [Candidatus Venteria ishoeyi]SEH07183.1 Uncharacterised protein [Candidatus Venteria ishoeyi]
MKQDNIAEGIGKEIIKSLNDYNEKMGLDDAEYIPLIKRVIEAITIFLDKSNQSNEESNAINTALFNYSKELYIDLCQKHAIEDNEEITIDNVQEESGEYFSYIYENEEHPN